MGQPGDMGTHTRFIPLGPGLLFPRPEMPSLHLGIQFRCHILNSKLSYCFHSTRVNRHANVLQWISSSPLHCQHLRMGPRFGSPAVAQRVSPDTWLAAAAQSRQVALAGTCARSLQVASFLCGTRFPLCRRLHKCAGLVFAAYLSFICSSRNWNSFHNGKITSRIQFPSLWPGLFKLITGNGWSANAPHAASRWVCLLG